MRLPRTGDLVLIALGLILIGAASMSPNLGRAPMTTHADVIPKATDGTVLTQIDALGYLRGNWIALVLLAASVLVLALVVFKAHCRSSDGTTPRVPYACDKRRRLRVFITSWGLRLAIFLVTLSGGYYLFGYEGPREGRRSILGPMMAKDADGKQALIAKEEYQLSPLCLTIVFGKVKKAELLTERGWKQVWVWRRCLPPNWNDDFSTLLRIFVPENTMKEECARLGRSEGFLEAEFGLDRFTIHDKSYYVLKVKSSELSKHNWSSSIPVVFSVADSYPEGYALAAGQHLPEQEATYVSKHGALYLKRSTVRRLIEERSQQGV